MTLFHKQCHVRHRGAKKHTGSRLLRRQEIMSSSSDPILMTLWPKKRVVLDGQARLIIGTSKEVTNCIQGTLESLVFTSDSESYPWFRYLLKYTWHLLERRDPSCQLHYSETREYCTASTHKVWPLCQITLVFLPAVLLQRWRRFWVLPLTLSSPFEKKCCGLTRNTTKLWGLHFLELQQPYRTKSNLTLPIANCKPSLPFAGLASRPLAWFCLSSTQV